MRYLFFFFILCGLSCATPQKKLKKQDYLGASKSALKEIKKGKNPRENKLVLEKAMTAILAEGVPIVEELSGIQDVNSLEKAIKKSASLQEKITAANQYLIGVFDEDKNNLIELDQQNSILIYDISFAAGQADLRESISSGYKQPAIDAYYHFVKASRYTYETQLLDSLKEVCIDYGTFIYQVKAGATFDIGENWDIDREFDNVERFSGDFLEVYYDGIVSDADCRIEVDFRDLDFDIEEDKETLRFEKEIIDGYDVEVDTAGVETEIPIYKTIEGGVVVTKIVRVGSWEANVRISNSTKNCGLRDNFFSASRQSEIFEYETFGDERAIPSEYEDGRSDDLVSEDDMTEEMLEEIYDAFVRAYF